MYLGAVAGKRVNSISPSQIGNGGGAVTILGDGFAADGFSQFDASKGNKVKGVRFKPFC